MLGAALVKSAKGAARTHTNTQLPSSGIVASAIGFLSLRFGTSDVVGEIRAALNTMWDVKPQEDGIWGRNLFPLYDRQVPDRRLLEWGRRTEPPDHLYL